MPFKFNPFSGNFDQTGSGGGGSSYIDGEVQNFSALPQTVGSPAVDSAYLVREAEGAWLLNRKPAGIYIRTANTGTRASDWTYAGEFPDVFNDANLVVYNNTDSTKNVKFDASAIATGTTRTISVPDKNITLDDASDSRTPSLHSSTHHTGGTDAIAPNQISAAWALAVSSQFITGNTLLSAGRNRRITLSAVATANIDLPHNNNVDGDVVTLVGGQTFSGTLTIRRAVNMSGGSPAQYETLATMTASGQSFTFVSDGTATGWSLRGVDTHTHAASGITSGTLDIARIPTGTGSTQVALGNHTHELTSLAATGATNGHVLTANGSGGVTFAAASGGGVSAVNSTLADILSVSGSDLVADDLGADKLYGFDDSEGKAIGFTIGSGLSVSGDTISATASGGSKTYAVFTAEHNQPPSTAFATLDTRNSIAVLDFDAATDENAVFVGIMPEGASLGSGLIVQLHWMATTATSGNVRWGVQFERSNTDLDSDSFDTAVEATAAANGTSGIITTTAITVADFDGITAGDVFRLKVYRNADDATNDTMTGDAELVAVEVRSAA